tara:strand:+ start:673 stop:924 length:252 start_codon:yes stop_codon:yes gene_type:complete
MEIKMTEDNKKCALWEDIVSPKKNDGYRMTLYSNSTVADVKKYGSKGSVSIQTECNGKIEDKYIGNEESAVKLAKAILKYYNK